jgi:glycosyltransferase involved in cell wall biosynthesis
MFRNIVTLGGAYLHRRREQQDSDSDLTDGTPLVTVIVPAFNEEKSIGKTIDSLLKLSYVNKEIIIVDDGSTDGTLEAARKYVANYSTRVRAHACYKGKTRSTNS